MPLERCILKTFNNLPLLAMRGNFFFPNVKAKVEVARTISRNAVKFALENGGIFFMVSQVDATQTSPKELGDVYDVGVIAEVLAVEKDDEQSVIIRADIGSGENFLFPSFHGYYFR